MILLDRVTRAFGSRVLFRDLTWQIHPGRRIGLVGPNGAGKTTLFRTIAREHETDGGRVVMGDDVTIGYLPQDVGDIGDSPVVEYVLQGRPDLVALEHRIHDLTEAVEHTVNDTDALARLTTQLGEAQERYGAAGGYELRARAQEVLRGMGFNSERIAKTARQLSGGWKVRLVLAKLLLQRPSLLLMDEPTNHLDIPSIEWLEGFLQSYEGTVILISHDRYFLNKLVNEIAVIDVDGFAVYPGNYDAFETQRAEKLELLEKQKTQQDRQIKEAEKLIDRFRAKASKAAMVQSRVKALEKIERIELPGERRKMVRFRFAEAPRSGRVVASLKGVSRSFGDLVIYKGLSADFERGEKVAIVGPNGAGKTTLLRLIRGHLPPDAGQIELGHLVVPAWFGQHQVEELNLTRTIIEEMESYATFETMPQVRGVLGAFLFSGDEVQRKISILSGGEKARVALARLLLRPSNLLLLDEPTNHLDMESREVLQDALAAYEGTVVFVSHDRHFINAVATRVVHIEDAVATNYPGNYEYYRFKRDEEAQRRAELAGPAPTDGPRDDRRDRKRREADLRNELSRATRDLRAEVAAIEARIGAAEKRTAEIEERMADPALYQGEGARVVELTMERASLKSELEGLYFKWAAKTEAIEAAEASIRARADLN